MMVQVCVSGCDDSTVVEMNVSRAGLRVLQELSARVEQLRGGCRPRVQVAKIPRHHAKEFRTTEKQ